MTIKEVDFVLVIFIHRSLMQKEKNIRLDFVFTVDLLSFL